MNRPIVWATAAALALVSLDALANPPFGTQHDEPAKPSPLDDPHGQMVPVKPLTPKDKAKRAALFREGKELIRDEKWKEASEKLHAALGIRTDAEILLWKGYAEERLEKLLTAREIYLLARAEAAQQKQPALEEKARQALDQLAKSLPVIKLKVPEGVSPMVYLDERVVKFFGDGIPVNPGTHTLHVAAESRQVYRAEVLIRAGEVQTIDVLLPLLTPPEPPRTPMPTGCGCRAASTDPDGAVIALVVGGLCMLLRRRTASRR